MSRTNERLTCATTRKLRKRERRKPAIDDSSFNAGTSCGFDDCSAGMRLKRIPVAIESSSAKPRTRQSVRRSKSKVTSLGRRMPLTALLIAEARNTPAAPPPSEMRRLSVSSCLTSRCRLAPTASRTAISRRRAVARASSRLARFTHASKSTSAPTAASTPVKAKTEFAISGINKPGLPSRIPRPTFSG